MCKAKGAQLWHFLVDEELENPNTAKGGPSSSRQRIAGGPMVAKHWMLAW